MRYALINALGAMLRQQDFDGQPPTLPPAKGLRWVPAEAPAYDQTMQHAPRPVVPVTGEVVEYVVEPRALDEVRDDIIARADAIARTKRDAVVAGISAAEMASWPVKRAEALAYQQQSDTAAAPSLALEAQARGVALGDLVGKVLVKGAALSALEAGIAGRCGAIQDAARAAADVGAIALVVAGIDALWPI